MNRYEKEDIQQLPSEYRPLGAWGYWGYNILFSLPIIGFIILIICALGNSNINRRSYARSFFCAFIVNVIIVVAIIVLFYSDIQLWLAEFERRLQEYLQQSVALAQ